MASQALTEPTRIMAPPTDSYLPPFCGHATDWWCLNQPNLTNPATCLSGYPAGQCCGCCRTLKGPTL